MRVIHSFGAKQIKRDIDNSVSFLLSNKLGGYCYYSTGNQSRYNGVFFNENKKMYKVIDEIKQIEESEVAEVSNSFSDVSVKRKNGVETFLMPYGYNSLIYGMDKEREVELILDVRGSYASPEFGRFYEIWEEDGKIVIKYRQENEFELYLVISKCHFQKTERWFPKEYKSDVYRNSMPFKKYVYSALKVRGANLVFSFGENKEKAMKENSYISANYMMFKKRQENMLERNIDSAGWMDKIKNKEVFFAYICAQASLYGLIIDNPSQKGIFAGLPWFFQFWPRDELISIKALMLMKKQDIAKQMLKEKIEKVKDTATFQNNNQGEIISADAMGWLFKRVDDLRETIPLHELDDIKRSFGNIMDISLKKNTANCFVVNNEKETWMDSLVRDGVRLEIQALRLVMYDVMHRLTDERLYYYLENKLKAKVRERFWNKRYLYDGIDDPSIRPNIFISYYLYPNLLHKMEWITCFHSAVQKLWCQWGGLSTIGKNSLAYHEKHTGEIPDSYHNGDSWFWVNNLTAIAMNKLDKRIFNRYIKKIVEGSTYEILWSGAIGSHAELSSASELKSEGCPVQAWSNATYIEMINEIYQ